MVDEVIEKIYKIGCASHPRVSESSQQDLFQLVSQLVEFPQTSIVRAKESCGVTCQKRGMRVEVPRQQLSTGLAPVKIFMTPDQSGRVIQDTYRLLVLLPWWMHVASRLKQTCPLHILIRDLSP